MEEIRPPQPLVDYDANQLRSQSGAALSPAQIETIVVAAYREYSAGVLRYACALGKNRELAQEAVQEVFLRYYIAQLKGQQILNGKAWLYRAARNYVLDRLKEYATRNCVSLVDGELQALPDGGADPEMREQTAEMFRRAAGTLSTRELECLQLRSEGLNYREIAGALNLRIGTVGTLLARGLKKFRTVAAQYQKN